ncbi:hypothetical protein Misp04_17030 [Micromonospora sp. NBRC 101691]|nr:hypothetical protein Misp04_17030 [Micromonospora sp. NBRC 101691]
MPRKVTRGRGAPEGGVTAGIAGIGWVFGYGIVTPVFSARAGGASSRRNRLRRLAGHRVTILSSSWSAGSVGAVGAGAYAPVGIT